MALELLMVLLLQMNMNPCGDAEDYPDRYHQVLRTIDYGNVDSTIVVGASDTLRVSGDSLKVLMDSICVWWHEETNSNIVTITYKEHTGFLKVGSDEEIYGPVEDQ